MVIGDETFEVFACYFPIDFTPVILLINSNFKIPTEHFFVNFSKPKSETFTITKEMLIKSLRKCFSSSKLFAKNAIPLFLDKLNSSVEDSQMDALQTFTECATSFYDPNEYKDFLEPLLSTILKIVMNAPKTHLEEAALESLRAMCFSISRCIQKADFVNDSSTVNKVSVEWFVNKVSENSLKYLSEPDLKLVWPNVKCLQSVASASSTSNLLVINKTIPLLIQHYESTTFVRILIFFN